MTKNKNKNKTSNCLKPRVLLSGKHFLVMNNINAFAVCDLLH